MYGGSSRDTPMTTLFAQRIDLSEGLKGSGITLYQRTRRQDTYTVGFSGVTIVHTAKREDPEKIESDPERGDLYLAGKAFDVFNVWVRVQNADPAKGTCGMSKCIGEGLRNFKDAVALAQDYLRES